MTETKVKRTTDARIARLRDAKAAAVKWEAAIEALAKAERRCDEAKTGFEAVANSAATPEENAFLWSLFPKQPDAA